MKSLLINVFGHHGYSVMIHGNLDGMTEEEVIELCAEKDVFQDAEEDAECASVVEADDNDIRCFYDDVIEV